MHRRPLSATLVAAALALGGLGLAAPAANAAPNPGGTPATAAPLAFGTTVSGSIAAANTADFYKITLPSAGAVTVAYAGSSSWSEAGSLWDRAPSAVCAPDPDPAGTRPDVVFCPQTMYLVPGDNYLEIGYRTGTPSGGPSGPYTLSVTFVPSGESSADTHGGAKTAATAWPIALGTRYVGQLSQSTGAVGAFYSRERSTNYYALDLPQPSTLSIAATSRVSCPAPSCSLSVDGPGYHDAETFDRGGTYTFPDVPAGRIVVSVGKTSTGHGEDSMAGVYSLTVLTGPETPMRQFTLPPDGAAGAQARGAILAADATGILWSYRRGGFSNVAVSAPGDLNGDGKPDLLGINARGDLYLFAGKGNGKFAPRVQVGSGWTGWKLYAAGDLNGDGKNDILGINAKGDLYQYLGKGTGTFAPRQQAGSGWNGNTLAAGADLNGDGLADIVGRNDTSRILYYYQGLGNAKFAKKVQIATGW